MMSIDHDEFEKRLRGLAKPLAMVDPTKEWKGEILRQAKAKSGRGAGRGRWMIGMLAAVWMLIGLMKVTMPVDDSFGGTLVANEGREIKMVPSNGEMAFPLLAARIQSQLLDLP